MADFLELSDVRLHGYEDNISEDEQEAKWLQSLPADSDLVMGRMQGAWVKNMTCQSCPARARSSDASSLILCSKQRWESF